MKKVFAVLVLILALAACKKQKTGSIINYDDGRFYGDMLVVGSIGEPLNLLPALASDSASHEVADLIYSGLVKVDKNMKFAGELAERWEVSSDNKSVTYYLRKDVLWHDGAQFSAEDVLFTYRFMLDNNTPTSYDSDFRKIAAIEAPDDYTVVVSYDEPFARALSTWSWILPKHLLEGTAATKSSLQRLPVGTGPYKFEKWDANQSLTLSANNNYFEGRPHLAKVMFRYLQDQSAAFLELLNGSIDQMTLTPAQYTRQTDTERFNTQYNKYKYLSNTYTYIGYNLTRKPFDDKRVRQALSYATPKERIITSVLHGLGVAATGPYKPGSIWHNPNVKIYEYDLEKARMLLTAAGYSLDNKGRLVKEGKPLKIELITNQNTTRVQIAEIIQQSWAELGIEVVIRVAEWGSFLHDIERKNFDATILAWNIVIDPDPSAVWRSDGCESRNTLNFICFQNKIADTYMDAASVTLDENVRKIAYDKFQELLAEEQPYTFLFVPDVLVALSSRIEGIEPAPAGLMHNFIDWHVPAERVKYKVQ